MKRSFLRPGLLFPLLVTGLILARPLLAEDSGASVVVVYNTQVPESKQVADYYVARRQVPARQVFGFKLPTGETMTRQEYLDQLETPLRKNLEANQLLVINSGTTPPRVEISTIRYAVLCYGVPLKILHDPKLSEPGADPLRTELKRTDAAVDSQLACLPALGAKWTGPLDNPGYRATNAVLLQPAHGVLMVTRLDGPSAAIARGLVDKAMEAETNGLWGRAYFDARGLTTGDYQMGDEWIRGAAATCRRLGFETELDDTPATFSAGFPMSQIAFYAGWYDGKVSGPFTRPQVEFMPGAFAYHLHSFSAQSIRTTEEHWVGPLLNKGATITMGCVEEPYLSGTPDINTFIGRLIYLRTTFGEAAYCSQPVLSWQTTVVGDPLYRPFGRRPDLLHADLEQRQSKLVEWSHLRVVNLNLANGAPTDEAANYLEQIPAARKSPVLREKLADLYWAGKKYSDAIDTYDEVLKLGVTPQQKIRLLLTLGQKRAFFSTDETTFATYESFLKEFPDYPDLLSIYKKSLPLAKRLKKKEFVTLCEQEIKRLSPPPPPAGPKS